MALPPEANGPESPERPRRKPGPFLLGNSQGQKKTPLG
jgi:hypothetical protein